MTKVKIHTHMSCITHLEIYCVFLSCVPFDFLPFYFLYFLVKEVQWT